MKFFLDSANIDEVKRALTWRIIDGVTTNPTLIAREGVPLEVQLKKICELVDGDVSAPVTSESTTDMLAEARSLSRLHPNIVVKVPVTPQGIAAVAELSAEGVRTNVTLCFSAAQALLAAKAGATYVSPFLGRVEDAGGSGVGLVRDIVSIYTNFGFETRILAASIRGPHHLVEAAKAGAHVATLTYKMIESLFQHPLTDKGLEQFLADYNRAFTLSKA
jgi:transaldolase